MPLKLVVMDHDGVVMDSNGEVYGAICELCAQHSSFPSRAVPSFLEFLEFFRLPGDRWFTDAGFDFPSPVIRETLCRAPEGSMLFSTVPPMLQRLKESSRLPIVMVSAGNQIRIEEQLVEAHIRNHFELVFGEEENKVTVINDLQVFFNLDPQAIAYVGDRPSDMEEARAAGVIAIGFSGGRRAMEEILTRAGAQHCVPTHEKLGDLLLNLARARVLH